MAIRDVVIIGAGPAGLAMACSLVRSGLAVTVVEKLDESVLAAPPVDGRDIALTFRSRDILQSLGIWQRLPEAFAPDVASRCRRVTQTSELREAMTESITSDTLTLVEVMLPKMDIPDFLRAVTQALEERNSRV